MEIKTSVIRKRGRQGRKVYSLEGMVVASGKKKKPKDEELIQEKYVLGGINEPVRWPVE